MSDSATAPKAKKAAKSKTPAMSHPKYSAMIVTAIQNLKERSGSSRQAILKYIMANYNVGENGVKVNARLKIELKKGAASGSLKQTKGTGASGSFRVGEKDKAAPKKVVKPKKAKSPKEVKKPVGEKKAAKPKKAKSPKKAAKKPAAKRVKTPMKTAKKPAAKKAAKPPKKAAKKPAAKKPVAKKPAAKKAAKAKK